VDERLDGDPVAINKVDPLGTVQAVATVLVADAVIVAVL
jgi:hypothetical protein